jgi:hypothetical protein
VLVVVVLLAVKLLLSLFLVELKLFAVNLLQELLLVALLFLVSVLLRIHGHCGMILWRLLKLALIEAGLH